MIDIEKILNSESTNSNPLLQDFQIPGATYKLPSNCVTYDNSVVTEKTLQTGEVHVYPLTVYDEIELKSVDRLLNGDVIINIFKRRIPDILDPEKLLSLDVDFLLVALRQVTYGNKMEIEVKHNCENGKFQEYEIDILPFIVQTKKIDPTIVSMWEKKISTGHTIKFKPANYFDVLQILQIQGNQNATDKQRVIASFIALATCIQSINSIEDKEHIIGFLQNLPVNVIKDEIGPKISEVDSFGVFRTVELQCGACGETYEFDVSLDPVHFF